MKIFPPRISQSSVGNTAPFQDMLQRWRAVGKTVSDLTGPRLEPPTSRSRDERITARPTGQQTYAIICNILHKQLLIDSKFCL